MNKLEELLVTYHEHKHWAEFNMDNADPRSAPGIQARKNLSKVALPEAKLAYLEELKSRLFFVMLTGPSVQSFVETAHKEADLAEAVDAGALLERLCKVVEPSLSSSRVFSSTQLGLLIQELTQVAMELDVEEMDAPKWANDGRSLPTSADVKNTIKDLILSGPGKGLFDLFFMNQVAEACLQAGMFSAIVPVLVVGVEGQDWLKSYDRQLSVEVPAECSSEFVLGIFNNVKKLNKTNKKKDTNNE